MAKFLLKAAASSLDGHRLAFTSRQLRRAREKRGKSVGALPAAAPLAADLLVAPGSDPVRIAVLAMEGLGRATMRASFRGTEVEVTVPDARTAAVFEAALAETAQRRPTDRLIRIVIGYAAGFRFGAATSLRNERAYRSPLLAGRFGSTTSRLDLSALGRMPSSGTP
jgi:hypothetical protein